MTMGRYDNRSHRACYIVVKKKTGFPKHREDFYQILSHLRPGHTIHDHGGSMAFELHEESANSQFKIVTEGLSWHR